MIMKHIQPNSLILPALGLATLLSSMVYAANQGNDMTKRLERCPASPNCVSSYYTGSHGIPPLQVAGESELPGGDTIVDVALFTVGNLAAFSLGALVGAIQALRLEYYELFSRLFIGQGRPFRPWHIPAKRLETS